MTDPAPIMSRLRSSFAKTTFPKKKSVKTTQGQLDVLDQVLTEVEQSTSGDSSGVIAQAIPQVALEETDTLNPKQAVASLKESEAKVSPDIGPVEAGAGLQQVEYEPNPELPVEVESYLEKVENKPDQALKEVVIADGTTQPSTAHPPVKKPVVVLPITEAEEKEGQKKPVHWSIRWLVEWSRKIMKMFAGEVVYRQDSAES